MTMFEYPFWKAWGMNGVAEWQTNWVILSKLTRASPDRTRGPRISWIITLHLWHGVAAGIVFGLLLPLLTLLPAGNFSVLLDAVVYSIALWLIFIFAPRRSFESAGDTIFCNHDLLLDLPTQLVKVVSLGVYAHLV